ncbi:hypothetical protein [Bradyrhizobium yuanmingense]|uniref:hypothetical protein n=1 Tax=Bradyrhizobium yuanmingense TaxID=108015 RepID=UPI0035180E48
MNHPAPPRSSGCLLALIILASVAAPVPAHAHVKWFAPYIVGAPPQSIGATLTNVWFWTGIALVLAFFLASRAIEKSSAGETILLAMDRITDPLWMRLDDFVRVVIAAFFVAIFAVGRRLPDARSQNAGRMGVLDPAPDRRVDLLSQDAATCGSRDHRLVATRAARL